MPDRDVKINIRGLRKSFGSKQVLDGVDHALGAAEELPFALPGPPPPPEVRSASVSAYVDVDGNGRLSPGDLVSQESYPAPLDDSPSLTVEVLLYQPDIPQGE